MVPLTRSLSRIHALILDRQHRCLLVGGDPAASERWAIPGIDLAPGAPAPERPLVVLQTAIGTALGLTVPSPAGSYVPVDGSSPRDFAFLVQEAPIVQGAQWLPLPKAQAVLAAHGQSDKLWRMYVETMLGGYEPPRRDLDVFSFGSQPEQAAKLAHLVIKGVKRSTSGWIAATEKQGGTIPWPGLTSLVTDYYGYPLCVIETIEVRKVPFRAVGSDIAAAEGEGDLSYADWREGHIDYFRREAAECGLPFNDDSLVFNEIFRVVKVLGREGPHVTA